MNVSSCHRRAAGRDQSYRLRTIVAACGKQCRRQASRRACRHRQCGSACGAALKALDPDFKPDYIGAAPFPGFREVVVGGQVLYVSDDGRYLMQAQPFDIQNKQFAASAGLLAYRRKQLETIPKADRIVFAPANPKYAVTVFTDVECGYCRKLHSEIAELNKQGIAVEYVAFPRMGLGSQDYKDMVAVWSFGRPQAGADQRQVRSVGEFQGLQEPGVDGVHAGPAPGRQRHSGDLRP